MRPDIVFGADIIEFELRPDDVVDGFGGADRRRFDHPRQLVVFGDDPVHAHLGSELDLFGGLLIGRIRGGDDQAVAALAENDDPVGLAELGVKQVLRQALRIDRVEIQQWGAECA